MDQTLIGIIAITKSPVILLYRKDWDVVDAMTGEISVNGRHGREFYKLKPLEQLFGQGRGLQSLDTGDPCNEAILMSIELAITHFEHDSDSPSVQDGDVLLALKTMSMNPAVDPGNNALIGRIQLEMRLCLSLNDFSKQEAKLAVRKIHQSAQRHNRESGVRGYLGFIEGMLGRF